MRITERQSVGMGSSSEQQMVEPIGLARPVEPGVFFMACPLRMPITERLWVKVAPFFERRMEALPGFTRRAGQASFCGPFRLPTQTMGPLSVKEDSFSERRMEEILG